MPLARMDHLLCIGTALDAAILNIPETRKKAIIMRVMPTSAATGLAMTSMPARHKGCRGAGPEDIPVREEQCVPLDDATDQ